jgi:DNA-binding beta-propeller fold protein YncE
VSVSPDGKDVYVASIKSESVTAFARDADSGVLTPLPGDAVCVSNNLPGGTEKCPRSARGLSEVEGIAFTPDGRNVYVGAFYGSDVAEFSRDTSTGRLSQFPGRDACIKDVAAKASQTDCPVATNGLNGVRPMAVSPDGRFLYVPADSSGTIDVFAIARGALARSGSGDL